MRKRSEPEALSTSAASGTTTAAAAAQGRKEDGLAAMSHSAAGGGGDDVDAAAAADAQPTASDAEGSAFSFVLGGADTAAPDDGAYRVQMCLSVA